MGDAPEADNRRGDLAREESPWSSGGLLARGARLGGVVSLALLPLPIVMGEGFGPLVTVAVAAGLVAAIARAETGEHRWRVVQLAVLGAAVRAVYLAFAAMLQSSGDVVVLGPDGARFLGAAMAILNAGFDLPESPFTMFGSYDVGHLYVFAALISLFGRSLVTLQVFNCAASALIAPLTYAWVRRVAPAAALPAAFLVAVYPSIVYLAAIDIWKDPLVITATTAGIWALTRLAHESLRLGQRLLLTAVGGASLAFVHMCRFYPLWYLEVGIVAIALVRLARRAPLDARAAAAIVAVMALAEGVPAAAGWPGSPREFAAGIVQATSASSMSRYTAGLLDRLASGAGAPGDRGTAYRMQQLEGYGLEGFRARAALQVDIETRSAESGRFGVLGAVVQVVRRVWGPFIWVAPPSLSAHALLGGDYLLYPGMVFWYALLPFMAAGLMFTGIDILRGRAPFALGVVWVYAVAYSGQFLVINLPYRQREAMFPVLVVFAVLAAGRLWSRAWIRNGYVVYWVALAALAIVHTAIRLGMAQAG